MPAPAPTPSPEGTATASSDSSVELLSPPLRLSLALCHSHHATAASRMVAKAAIAATPILMNRFPMAPMALPACSRSFAQPAQGGEGEIDGGGEGGGGRLGGGGGGVGDDKGGGSGDGVVSLLGQPSHPGQASFQVPQTPTGPGDGVGDGDGVGEAGSGAVPPVSLLR